MHSIAVLGDVNTFKIRRPCQQDAINVLNGVHTEHTLVRGHLSGSFSFLFVFARLNTMHIPPAHGTLLFHKSFPAGKLTQIAVLTARAFFAKVSAVRAMVEATASYRFEHVPRWAH